MPSQTPAPRRGGRRTPTTPVEPYRLTLAYRYSDLRRHKGNCPRTVVVYARDVEDAIGQVRALVPHFYGITRAVQSSTTPAVDQ